MTILSIETNGNVSNIILEIIGIILILIAIAVGCITKKEEDPMVLPPVPILSQIITAENTASSLTPSPSPSRIVGIPSNATTHSNGVIPTGPIPIPDEDLKLIGWSGALSRDDSELKLGGFPTGTFLTRWSANTNSYVVSYSVEMSIIHLAFIRPREGGGGGVRVELQNGRTSEFNSLLEYINKQREEIPDLGQPITVLGEPIYHNINEGLNIDAV